MTARKTDMPTPPDKNALRNETFSRALDEELPKILKRYRADVYVARKILAEELAKTKAAESGTPYDQFRRTREYKDAVARARKRIYYSLRQYRSEANWDDIIERGEWTQQDVDHILSEHVSTRERLGSIDEFHEYLLPHYRQARTVIDIGCGVYPLAFPFAGCDVEHYLALDRDRAAIDAIGSFSSTRNYSFLHADLFDLAKAKELPASPRPERFYDLAIMLKLVPVVARQLPNKLSLLHRAPAKKMIVSGARKSMTKNIEIERRELSLLKKFATESRCEIVDEFRTSDEVVLILERSDD